MRPRIRSHLRSNLVGYLALVVALSGPGASAAAKITAAAVTAGKLAPGAVPTVLWAKVENNSGTPSLVQASGAIAVAAAGTDRSG